ncbi:SUMF1/EgtB/PvdO family nonheme iron enzyme [Rhodoplanes sp. TEM]|uniref:SUMF1/EgtB/PvdO family nonheme iron enzyme n=1 Tax=Rhodoplanes tepidamans TaxID=200616 RepID=A0ABT5J3T5_RHOTP|nr:MULTISPECIES: SUMF1/EgtB/PvdO family nonheme iron enzyme [Rhodoplanes]MDC7784101.1 SUMF1/EgtB/PvdO family nonheme iron enzyme [Rhodoplanes tepidamans]MDC7983196.1 SUMF1/EgtB/PvdO family nonheme iron enzyme [Rhodoplanes sp. TEM]MDQ0356802.1 formylglycine-generating enzyme required for sulfatase activity [Rhodoplanes tepidamans]
MLIASGLKIAVAALVAGPLAVGGVALLTPIAPPPLPHAVVTLAPGAFAYRLAGDFSTAGRPVAAPRRQLRQDRPLAIMTRQVTAAEYASCVEAGACPRIPQAVPTADRPVVGVSFRDALAYADWITRQTGVVHRLPTDAEWVFAAAEKASDEALPVVDAADPAKAWLARYETESARERPPIAPQPVGTFGANANGLVDLAGNVWEWTATCFERAELAPSGAVRPVTTNCGVRVVQGEHRTYMTDFIRDPRTGGCAAGVPPANLGFRLVVETALADRLRAALERTARRLLGPG